MRLDTLEYLYKEEAARRALEKLAERKLTETEWQKVLKMIYKKVTL